MKRLTESFGLEPKQQIVRGVMNHYTPIDNIIINVRNIFGALLGLVCTKGEDGISMKVTSTSFTNPQTTEAVLRNSTFDGVTFLYDYIYRQGLHGFKVIDLGSTCIAYFYPDDVTAPEVCAGCTEMREAKLLECEMHSVNEDCEVELEDRTKEELAALLNNTNKVKAAADFAEMAAKSVTLPENTYIKATKDADGRESIALRCKLTRRRPFGGTLEQVSSLMNIYGTGNAAVWVDAYLDGGKEKLPDGAADCIDSILELIGAEKTEDEAVWNIPDGNVKSVGVDTTTDNIANQVNFNEPSGGQDENNTEQEQTQNDEVS